MDLPPRYLDGKLRRQPQLAAGAKRVLEAARTHVDFVVRSLPGVEQIVFGKQRQSLQVDLATHFARAG